MGRKMTGWRRKRWSLPERNPTRRLRAEALEPRRLLVTLTVITPDEGGSFPNWAYDMATAIVAKDGVFDRTDANGDGIVDLIQNSRIDLSGQRQLVGSGQFARNLVLFDWTSVSDQAGIADSALVTDVMNDWIEANMLALDFHFIGHGRGAMVNMGILRNLSTYAVSRVQYLQMTTLDGYARGDDGAFEANPGGIVDFADNYYQNIDPQQASGAPLPGALNFRLNDPLAAWAGRAGAAGNHREVHDWYHWTIAPELDANSVPRSDADLLVPDAGLRAALYDAYAADLNADGAPDDFQGGETIGYYFTLAGGGIGKTVLVANPNSRRLYTLDVLTGELPLYLGSLYGNPPNQIAYHPQGDLFYNVTFASQLARARVEFDANNVPVWTHTLVGTALGESFPFTMEFSMDGRLARGEVNLLMELSPENGQFLRATELDWGWALVGAMAFDSNFNLFLVRVPPSQSESASLMYFDTTTLEFVDGFDIPYRDIEHLAMIEGLLYAIRENGEALTINVMTRQIIERGPLALPAGASLNSLTSTTDQVHPRWHNRALPYDVNEDGRVNSSDILTLINTLLLDGARSLNTNSSSWELRSHQYDVTNDLRVNTSDLLAVINHILLNEEVSAPAAAEPLAAPVAFESPNRSPLDWIAFATELADDDEDEAEPW